MYRAIQSRTKSVVAVKMLRDGLLATPTAHRRFEREIELASLLRHPNIVSVFHAGETVDRCSFCVMDYVQGVPLSNYIRENDLVLSAAMRLFADVCGAIHYAHQRGVIHRDLKPSNILVDTDGVPKVLDFGLARMISDGGNETQTGQVMGTLAYMSPEQARGIPSQVDTRTDVYSLGVILYEILSGRLPFPVSQSLMETLRHITDTPPEPPRQAWTPNAGIHKKNERSSRDSCPIDNDLETIVLRALAKDPDRRYGSALLLQQDILAYLDGRPIDAKRDNLAYVVRLAVRRHKLAAAASVLVAALVLGWAVSTQIMAKQVRIQRDEARIERRVTDGANVFLREMLTHASPTRQGSDATILASIRNAETWLPQWLATQREQHGAAVAGRIEATIRGTIGATLLELGDFESAANNLNTAHRLRLEHLGNNHPTVADSFADLGRLHFLWNSDTEQAASVLRQALEIADGHTEMSDLRLAQLLGRVAENAYNANDLALAWRSAGRAYLTLAGANAPFPESVDYLSTMSAVLAAARDLETSEGWRRQVVELDRTLQPEETGNIATGLNDLGIILLFQGYPDVADSFLVDAHQLRVTLKDDRSVADSLRAFALRDYVAGDLQSAEQRYRDAIDMQRRAWNKTEHMAIAWTNAGLAAVLHDLGREDEAAALYDESARFYRSRNVAIDSLVQIYLYNRAEVHRRQRDWAEAERLYETAMTSYEGVAADAYRARALNSLALLYAERGVVERGVDTCKRAVDLYADYWGEDHPTVATGLADLGRIQIALGRLDDAETTLLRAIGIRQRLTPSVGWLNALTEAMLAKCRWLQGRTQEAHELMSRSHATVRDSLGDSDPRTQELATVLAIYDSGSGSTEVP